MPEDFPEDSDLNRPPSFFPYEKDEEGLEDSDRLIRVEVEGVYEAAREGSKTRFVVLSDGEHKLPIEIGPFESVAITAPFESNPSVRPMTHDLIKNILDRIDIAIERIVIDDLFNSTFYAKLYLRLADEELEVDSRPSDAIALALRAQAPIFVALKVLVASE